MKKETRVMRDALIECLYEKMLANDSIFFISADFGAPALDRLRATFPDRFINVGIAEQNLVNIATGLALEGYTVYAYAIAPFLSMRAYEQIRTNLSILSQVRPLNVNLVGVGAGLSYDVTGPTHHCLEDTCIMTVLPNFTVCSPSDAVLTEKLVDFTLSRKSPKYLRLDGKAQPNLYRDDEPVDFGKGFHELRKGGDVGIVSTGYMTHVALGIAAQLAKEGLECGVVDVFFLKPLDHDALFRSLNRYKLVVSMEESFINKGSLDTIVEDVLYTSGFNTRLLKIGFSDKYVFEVGDRAYLHKVNGLDPEQILSAILNSLSKAE
ncbi:transketolase [Candidatus Parcubacteria bacterium]|nr:MAG: transketolase [Candidatus Parcubacteria bacterium]